MSCKATKVWISGRLVRGSVETPELSEAIREHTEP